MNKKILLVLALIGAGWGNYSNAQYCENGPTDALESNIEAVSLNGVNTTSLTYTGCPGVIGVEDETTQTVELVAGQEYTLDVTFGTCDGNFAGAGEAWIDFNQDDVFDAATESIGSSSGTPGTAPWDAPVAFTFTIPSTATTGATRIRIMQEEGGTTPLDPCASYTFGSVVDFTVDILAQPATPPTPDQDPGTPSCSTGSDLILAGTPPAGIDWYWQGTNSNGTSTADDGTAPYTVFGNGTYYARAYDPALDAWSEESSITISNFITPGTPQYIEEEYFACVGDPSIEIEVENPLGSGSLFTTNAGGNGCGGGAMFDLTTNLNEITVTSLDILPNTTATQNVSVYIKTTGGYNGSQTVPGDWTLIGTYSVNTTNGVPINVDVADFPIPPSTTYGVYVEYSSSYTNSATGTTYTNADLTLTVGDGLCNSFATINTGRAFNGTVFYDVTTPTDIEWFDLNNASTGSIQGTGNILETVGTSVLPTATSGTYDFYAFSLINGCYSNSGLHVEVHVAPVNVEVTGIDATCNGSETGTFDITDTLCGVAPFTYSVDGGTFGPIPTDLLPGSHTVIVQDDNGDESGEYTFTVGEADEPSDLVVINIVADGGQVSWNANGDETEWNVEWGLPGFAPGTGNEIGSSVVTDTFDIITGLNPNTEYDVYVSANCGVGSVTGDWGTVSFITDCGIEVTPFSENFDSPNWVSGTGFNNTGDAISPCWTRSAGTFFFGTRTGTTSNAATGPLDDFTGGGNYIYTEGSVGTNGDLATITTPEIDLTYLTDPYLTFYYHMYGADITSLEVEVTNDGGLTWTNEASIVGQQQSSNADIWIDRGVNLAAYFGDTIQVRFSTTKAGFNADLAIDEIEIKEAPTCPKPTDFMTGTVLDVSVELEWVNGGSETMWNIEYGPAGFTQGTGTTVASTTNPETITGLSPETGYDFYIQADCGGGDESDWVGPINVVTECAAFVAPFLESFDIGSLPNCWSNTSSNTTSANTLWKFGTGVTGGATSNGRPAGTYAWSDGSTPVVNDVTLTSPLIDLSALTVPTLSFDWFSNNTTTPGDNVPLFVDINDGSGWTNLLTLAGDDTDWQKEELTLAAYIGQTVQLRFVTDQTAPLVNAFNNDILLDSVSVEEGPSCPKPTPINVTNIAATSVDLDWLAGYLETEWIVEYDTTGFPFGTGNTLVTTNLSETLNGLTPNTGYDVYVRAICAPGDTSDYRGPSSFTTPCLDYVAPFYENFDNSSEWVSGAGANNNGDMISQCWSRDPIQSTSSAFWGTRTGTTGGASTGPDTDFSGTGNYMYFESSYGSAGVTAELVTPTIDMSNIDDPVLTFYYHMYGSTMGTLQVEISNDGGVTWDSLYAEVGQQQTAGDDPWEKVTVELYSYEDESVLIRFLGVKDGFNGDVAIDEMSVYPCIPAQGQNGSDEICRLDLDFDLNSAIVKGQDNGVWSFPPDNSLIVNDTIFNVSLLPSGSYDAYYIVPGACEDDTTIATVNVYPPSSAGQGEILNVCRNQPIDLYSGLSGNVDHGGTWYDSSDDPIAGSQQNASNLPGQYNFDYITSNGICPSDTSLVTVIVSDTCDYLSLGEEKLTDLSVFPNPATDVINILNPSGTESLRLEMLDMNGRVVISDVDVLSNTSEATITIDHLQKGIYTLRIYNEKGQRTFKVVKQ